MNFIAQIQKLGGFVTDLVFPISCLVCSADGTYLCNQCLASLPRLEKQKCLVCQKPAPFGKTHINCASRNSVDGAISGLLYRDRIVRDIIRVFKYNFVSDLKIQLTKVMVEAINNQGLSNYFQDFVLVPVPLHPRRLNWRGFNQSELLSSALAEKLNLETESHLITRRKYTKPQVELLADERKRNINNAFELVGNAANKKLLLVDDLVTSGSTANELARILKKGKASEVWIISAAHG